MTTSEERYRIAEALQGEARGCVEIAEEIGRTPTVDLWDVPAILQDLTHYCGLDGVVSWRELLNRFAELIDPTCEITTDQVDDGEWGAHEIYECCSECGNQNVRDRFTGKPYRFCPHCGARVMRGEDDGD